MRESEIAISNDRHRRPDVRYVGPWETGGQGDGNDARPLFKLVHVAHDLVHRRVRRDLFRCGPEQRDLVDRADRSDLALHRANHDVGGLPSPFGHVHVREGIKADNRIRRRHPCRCVVPVQIERGDHRPVRSDLAAEGCDHVPIAVVDPVHHHRAMQIEQDTIDGSFQFRLFQPSDHLRDQRRIVVRVDQSAGECRGAKQRYDVNAGGFESLDKPARADVRAAILIEDFAARAIPRSY